MIRRILTACLVIAAVPTLIAVWLAVTFPMPNEAVYRQGLARFEALQSSRSDSEKIGQFRQAYEVAYADQMRALTEMRCWVGLFGGFCVAIAGIFLSALGAKSLQRIRQWLIAGGVIVVIWNFLNALSIYREQISWVWWAAIGLQLAVLLWVGFVRRAQLKRLLTGD
ncbi:MAG: hypothetical protein HYT88_01505 [Candidatus Omnitrophica bacterium]|nr:hypothetical protein [Candidatus Omnitrophota bacterium]